MALFFHSLATAAKDNFFSVAGGKPSMQIAKC